jgi:magnesium-transporting ATPase (P-type)
MARKNDGPRKPVFPRPPYLLPVEQVVEELNTNVETGLSPAQAQENLSQYGGNRLDGGEGIPLWKVFVKQVSNAM